MKLVSIKAKRKDDIFYLDGVGNITEKFEIIDELTLIMEGYLYRKVDENNFYYILDVEHEHKNMYDDDELNNIYPTLLSKYLSYIRNRKINIIIN